MDMTSQQQFSQDNMIGKAIGHYVVRHKLGEGGMGSVYIAEQVYFSSRELRNFVHGRRDVERGRRR
jgi:hypothetical protein